ncbi:MAG: diaminobutyrate decarboxylase, partial [Treponema sp.]|nr:diaminobutyrate decarboxylase [Candidatus Treponema equi]
ALTIHADYLNREEDEEDGYTNLVDKSLQTTRRFDALKVWMSFLARGKDGWSHIITKVMDNARYFYSVVSANKNFFVVTEPEISSVVFRVVNESKTPEENDEMNKKIRRTLLHKLGIVVGQTVSDHRVCLKFTLLNPNMTHEKLDSLVKTIEELGASL